MMMIDEWKEGRREGGGVSQQQLGGIAGVKWVWR